MNRRLGKDEAGSARCRCRSGKDQVVAGRGLASDENDLDIYDWLLGRSLPPSEEFRRLIARLNGSAG